MIFILEVTIDENVLRYGGVLDMDHMPTNNISSFLPFLHLAFTITKILQVTLLRYFCFYETSFAIKYL